MAAVAFDSTYLMLLLDPLVKAGATEHPRVVHLFKTLDKAKTTIIIPTPALSELLIGAEDAAPQYLAIINKSARFRVAPFGERAAVEAADGHRRAIAAGDKKEGAPSWAKIKHDRQIYAISRVEGATCIYSNDEDVEKLAKKDGMRVVKLNDLPDPPPPKDADQGTMFSLLDPQPSAPTSGEREP
ncbi:PIN domain-containing protein [Bradyrhizobium oligotrophicum]|uniref:PIN domain-containing protein n=1 Tax=Bradyrhizobium oligotrophicum TaxID=44255 RepID=UPI003EBBF665